MEAYVSRRPEDGNTRDKPTRPRYATKEKPETYKTGPPMKKKVTFVESDKGDPKESKKKETTALPRQLMRTPYVDLPPKRMTESVDVIKKHTSINPVTANVKDQGSDHTITKSSPAYKSRAPVEIGLDIEKLVETVLDLEINVPLRSLAGVSGAIQKEIRRQVTKTKLPTETAVQTLITEPERPFIELSTLPFESCILEESEDIPGGIAVAGDPVLQYLDENKEESSDRLMAANISEPLRAIYSMINNVGQEECLLDAGSMIVSVAKEAAIQLGLTWDPSIRINMESASNHIEKTLGLARNVKFTVGGLNLFLQVHVLENPPYRVLLGRPFDVYSKSIVQTKSDGTSEVVLTDPNTKQIAIVPTYQRGVGPEELHKQQYQAF